jgi:hypothetical protein
MNQEDSQKRVISIKPGRVFLITSDFGDLLRRFCIRKTRWSSGEEHKLFEQERTQLPETNFENHRELQIGSLISLAIF